MSAIEDLLRHLLWLPEPGSTFAGRVDHLHYFVITVTMIASIDHRPPGVLLLLQVPRTTPQAVDAARHPEREVRDPRHRRAAVLLPALVRAGLQGLRLVHDAAQERDGRVRDGQEVDVEVRLRRRGAERHRDAARPRQPPGPAAHDQPRRHPLVLRPRLPHQAGRPPRPLHRDLVRGDQAGALPDPLRRVLRHLALADVGRGRGDGGARVRRVDARAAQGRPLGARRLRRRRRRRLPRLDRRVRQAGRHGAGLRQVPLARRRAAHRPDLARPLQQEGGRSRTARP